MRRPARLSEPRLPETRSPLTLAALGDAVALGLRRLVFGVRGAVLHQPRLRAVLRTLGRPAIKLMHSFPGLSNLPPPAPAAHAEPVLRLPLGYTPGPAGGRLRVAVLLHTYYVDVLPDIVALLGHIANPTDVYVSTDTAEKKAVIEAAFAGWTRGKVEVRLAPNRGRNIAPQLITFRDVYPRYDAVLLIHGKKSVHNDALGGWRDSMLGDLIGSPQIVAGVLETFARQPRIGLIAPRNYDPIRYHMIWGENYPACRDLGRRLGFALHPDSPLDFPAGAMLWARPAALRPLLDLDLAFEDFAPEAGQIDGTLAHAIERLFFHSCELAGLRWIHAGVKEGTTFPCAFLDADQPRRLRDLSTSFARTLIRPGRPPAPTPLVPPDREQRRALYRAELDAFLAEGRRIVLPTMDAPVVSILLVLFNQAELTLQCLKALEFALDVPCEIIVVDNASSDASAELMARTDGVRYVRNPDNRHFLRATNQAAALARGTHLLFLNNDTRLAPGSIAAAIERLTAEADLGAVGGRIDLADGTLQEAGSIIWSDGACQGYGRGGDPQAGEHQFARDVDYVSGAFLMTPRATFEALGGLDEAFAPAYYEETDYCLRLWARGLRTAYDPRIRLWHFEFGSSTTVGQALALQEKHRAVLVERHRDILSRQFPHGSDTLRARMRGAVRGRVLVIDDLVPAADLGAGSPRAIDLITALTEAGWFVSLYPLVDDGCDYAQAWRDLPRGVEILAERGAGGLVDFLRERAGYYDAAVVSRPHNMAAFRAALRRAPHFLKLSQVVYDAEAVFALRDPAARIDSPSVKAELRLARGVGAALVVSAAEAELFASAGVPSVEIVGHAQVARPTPNGFEARRDLLFVGALDETGPNSDSLIFFVREVMPRLDALIGADWILQVAGRNGAPEVQALANERVRLLGPVDDLTDLYDRARVFIAPTRFAAGIPMKVHEAAARGLPAAVTPLLADQLGWADGEAVMVGADADGFAAAVARLYADPAAWRAVREEALRRIATDCDPVVFAARIDAALRTASGR